MYKSSHIIKLILYCIMCGIVMNIDSVLYWSQGMVWEYFSPVEALPWLWSTSGTKAIAKSQHLSPSGDRRKTQR